MSVLKKTKHPFLWTALISGLIFGYVPVVSDDSGTYISGDSGTTLVYAIQLVVGLLCFLYVYKKVGKTIDYEKTLEEW